jgi:hypothetical protein
MSYAQGWTDTSRQLATLAGGASLVGLGGTGEYPDQDEMRSPVVPASEAFSIWGPIYLGNLATIGLQLLPSGAAGPIVREVGWPLAVAHAGAGLWSRTFSTGNLPLSLGLIGTTWAAAGLAYNRLPQGPVGLRGQWLVRVPVGLLFGWLTVATVASKSELLLTSDLVDVEIDPERFGIASVAGLGVLSSALTVGMDRTLAFPAAVAWGLGGIVAAQLEERPTVAAAAAGALLGLATATVYTLFRRTSARRRQRRARRSAEFEGEGEGDLDVFEAERRAATYYR